MARYDELKLTLRAEIRSSVTKTLTESRLNAVVNTVLCLSDYEIDQRTLQTIGKVLFDDMTALATADPGRIRDIVRQMHTIERTPDLP